MPKFSDFIKQDAKDKTLNGKKYSTVSSGDLIINKSPFISYGTNWAFINDNMENLLRLSSLFAKTSSFPNIFGSYIQESASIIENIYFGIKNEGIKKYAINSVNSFVSNTIQQEINQTLKNIGKISAFQSPDSSNIKQNNNTNVIQSVSLYNSNVSDINAIKSFIKNTDFLYNMTAKFENGWLLTIPEFPETWEKGYSNRSSYKNVMNRANNLGYNLNEIIKWKSLFTFFIRGITDYTLMQFATDDFKYPNKTITFINEDNLSKHGIQLNFILKKSMDYPDIPSLDDLIYLLRESAFNEETGVLFYPIDYMLPEVKLFFLQFKSNFENVSNTSNNNSSSKTVNTNSFLNFAKSQLYKYIGNASLSKQNTLNLNESLDSTRYKYNSIEIEKVVTYKNCYFYSTPPLTLKYSDDPNLLEMTVGLNFQDMEITSYSSDMEVSNLGININNNSVMSDAETSVNNYLSGLGI